MRVLALALVACVLLASCTLSPLPAVPTPFPTLTPQPSGATPTGAPPVYAPTPTPSTLVFRDDFNLVLANGWVWHGGDPHDLSLVAQRGYAEFTLRPGYAFEDGLASLLLRPAPQGDFEIETRLTFRPPRDYAFAGLIVYESRNAYLQAGREMCRNLEGCVSDGLYMDQYKIGRLQSGGLRLAYHDTSTVALRLRRQGQTYTFFASADGATWYPIGQRQSDINPVSVGLFAGQNPQEAPTAYFDYFEIRSIPPSD